MKKMIRLLLPIQDIFFGQRYEWSFSVPPDEVMRQLKELSRLDSYVKASFWRPGYKARIRDNQFQFIKTGLGNLPLSHNSFVHCFTGSVGATEKGTLMHAQFRLPIFPAVFVSIWLALAFLISWSGSLLGMIQYLRCSRCQTSQLGGLLFMFLFPLFGVLISRVCRNFSGSNEKAVLNLFEDVFGPAKCVNQKL